MNLLLLLFIYATCFSPFQHISVWSTREQHESKRLSAFMSMRQQKCAFGSDFHHSWVRTKTRRGGRPSRGTTKAPARPTRPYEQPAGVGPKMSPQETLKQYQQSVPKKVGPPRTEFYNPSYGFEPYWPGGNWVFDPNRQRQKKIIKTKITEKTKIIITTAEPNCNVPCNAALNNSGAVCGRNRLKEYKTFNSICEMDTEDCAKTAQWLIAYNGPCRDNLLPKTYPTQAAKILFGVQFYLDRYKRLYNRSIGSKNF